MQTDPLQILLQFDRWATAQLLDSCRTLDDAQLDQSFDIGLGSLRRILDHLAMNMACWLDAASGEAMRPFLADAKASVDRLSERFEVAWSEAAELLDAHGAAGMAETVSVTFDDDGEPAGTASFTRTGVLLHVFNHNTHHRAQCLNILRHLGVDPLPELDLIDSHQEVTHHDD